LRKICCSQVLTQYFYFALGLKFEDKGCCKEAVFALQDGTEDFLLTEVA
jgi:hypothetical protein